MSVRRGSARGDAGSKEAVRASPCIVVSRRGPSRAPMMSWTRRSVLDSMAFLISAVSPATVIAVKGWRWI
eukprot:5160594-Pleurochrysis_carterae.AAC.3